MLPYSLIGEAEAELGHSPTLAETLLLLYCHSMLLIFTIFTTAPVPLVIMELSRFAGIHRYKIQPHIRLSPSKMFRGYRDVIRQFFLVLVPLQLVSHPYIKMAGIRTGLPLPSGWEVLLQLLVYSVTEYYTTCWIHRWSHSTWGYEKIHHVHHGYTVPSCFTAAYTHWTEFLVLGFPSFLGPAMVLVHMITFWQWMALRHIESIETHRGFDFPWNPTKYIPFYGGADHHDHHHYVGQGSNSNFASIFTYCDFLYGTDKGYRDHKKLLDEARNPVEEEESEKIQ